MKKSTHPTDQKYPLSLKKANRAKTKFYNILNQLLIKQNDYCLVPEGVSNGKISGDLYAVFIAKRQKRRTIKTVSLHYCFKTRKVTITLFKGPIVRQVGRDDFSVSEKHTVYLTDINVLKIKNLTENWFKKKIQCHEIDISFKTQFMTLSHRKTYFVNNPKNPDINPILEDILDAHIKKMGIKELNKFLGVYRTKLDVVFNTITCKIISLETEEELADESSALHYCIGSELFEEIERRRDLKKAKPFLWIKSLKLRGKFLLFQFKKLWFSQPVASNQVA